MSFYSAFAEHYETIFPFRPGVLRFLTDHLPPGPQRLLDLGCGTGHYAGRLAAAGHTAVGIDVDPEMIAQARRSYPAALFHTLDLRAIDRLPGPLDAAFCIGNVAAHLDPAALADVLARLARHLRPGGLWVLQTVNWDGLPDHGDHDFPDRIVDGLLFRRRYAEITPERVRFRTLLANDERTLFAGEVDLFPLRWEACRRLHERAGFALCAHHGDYDGRAFDPATAPASIALFERTTVDRAAD